MRPGGTRRRLKASTLHARVAFAALFVSNAACRARQEIHVDSASAAIALAEDSLALEAPVVDTMVALGVDTTMPTVPSVGPSTRSPNDSAPASMSELARLRAALMVPVEGVQRGDLHDTYQEPRSGHTHEALDILAARGTPVHSATDGRLLKLHQSKAGGLMIYAADASDRFILMYGHLDRYAPGLVEGGSLRQGQVIGYVGTTGNAPAGTPHLHFAIARGVPSAAWWKGEPVNPYPLLAPLSP
jgi:septal ring factor EnvC (AmiA/AmiB activator)